jgi:hypothetical protein
VKDRGKQYEQRDWTRKSKVVPMKKRQRRYLFYSRLFLIEKTVVVLLLVFCTFQCTLAFVLSERIRHQASELNQAVIMAETIVEVWKAQGEEGLVEMLRFSQEDKKEKGDIVYCTGLNEVWEPVDTALFNGMELMMPHIARIEIHREDGLASAVVTISNNYSDPTVAYQGKDAEPLWDSGGHVVFVLRAAKFEGDPEPVRKEKEINEL